MSVLGLVVPVAIGLAFVVVMSLVRDDRRRLWLNAVVVAGASGTYLSGGALGPAELLGATAVLVCAFLGCRSWRWVGVAWLLHTALDVAHAARGADLLPWAPHSSTGCAICDPVIALWCFAGGRPVADLLRAALGRPPRSRPLVGDVAHTPTATTTAREA